jgi:hypothetical protein
MTGWPTLLKPRFPHIIMDMGKQPPFNVINTSKDGILKFDRKPNHDVARLIRERLEYEREGENAFPIVSFDALVDKISLGRAVDRCIWEDQDCVSKRIEFNCDVRGIDREIKSRETLRKAVLASCGEAEIEFNEIVEQRFTTVPILAVVVAEPGW